MNESYLIVLGAGVEQCIVYETAKKMGIKTIGIDYNKNAPGLKKCDIPINVSVKDVNQILKVLEEIDLNYIGVMTLGIEISPIVSAIAEKYNLVSVSSNTAFLTTNKVHRNIHLHMRGIPVPKFNVVKFSDQITLKYPFVVKPSDSSGSRGVRRVDYLEDVHNAIENAKSFSSDDTVLVEELLHGHEISIEGFMLNRKLYVTGFADRNYLPSSPSQPLFIENGSNSPSILPQNIIDEAINVFESAANALDIDGPTKGDLIVVNDKIIVIEVTSRLSGGGFCSRIQPAQNGTNIVKATIQWACRRDIDIELLIPKFNNPIVHRFYMHNSGIITKIDGIETAKCVLDVLDCVKQYDFKIGDILEPLTYINRLLYIITTGRTIKDAIEVAEYVLNDVINIKTNL